MKDIYIVPTYHPAEKFVLKVVGEATIDDEEYYICDKVFGNIRFELEDRFLRKDLIGSLYEIKE